MKVIITGTTGMVGRGVLNECLTNEAVTSILVVNRQTLGLAHPKLKEIIHKDFFDLSSIQAQLQGYDACFFCLGITSFRQSEENYSRITYDLTMHFAEQLAANKAAMTFIYVSGSGTDSTEKGRTMWARVKGKTENALLGMGFKQAFAFRPAYIKPDPNAPTKTPLYQFFLSTFGRLHPLVKFLIPKMTTTTEQIGKAMIAVTKNGYEKQHIDSVDIQKISARAL